MQNRKFDFNDIAIVPETISSINSRKEVNPLTQDGYLPLMVSPMDSVVDRDNAYEFLNNGLRVCLPRGIRFDCSDYFTSISLDEFEEFVSMHVNHAWHTPEYDYLLVDIANGHMEKLYKLTKLLIECKSLARKPQLMI